MAKMFDHFFKNKNILVTGGAGFIGSHICDQLFAYDVNLIKVIDNLSTGKLRNLTDLPYVNSNLKIVQCSEKNETYFFDKKSSKLKLLFTNYDIYDYDVCYKYLKDVDVVFHQAATGSVPMSIDNPVLFQKSNVDGFFNILLSMVNMKRQNHVPPLLIFASSSSVYGDNEDLPKCENNTGSVLSPYALTKCVNELYAELFSKLYGLHIIGLRYFNVFGPRQSSGNNYSAVIPKFINAILEGKKPQIFGDGTNSRDFTYVDNVVLANFLSATTLGKLSSNSHFYQVINIGYGHKITVLELFDNIKNKMKSKLEPEFLPGRKGDVEHSFSNIKSAEKLINYRVTISFDSGIENTIKYYTEKFNYC